MRVINVILRVLGSCALAVTLVGAGFLVCALPPVTPLLARNLADDVTSPFNKEELAQVADASRDFAFGSHNADALNRAIYEANVSLRTRLEETGEPLPAGFPQLELTRDANDPQQVASALVGASERYVFSADTIAHLDDCNAIARVAYPLVIVLALVSAACLVLLRRSEGPHAVGSVLLIAGLGVLGAFTALGIFAAIDFNAFFTLFHGVFFSQGNWQFAYDSLLICSLPEPFWAAMGGIWLVVSAGLCVACVCVGRKMRKALQ